ncbi:DNA-entry nuclease (competence-specific nuclease) [Saccharibacillus brassicae]|uniref:DNA-entry nuclease (Competence-specific nuclease) n=2 Tax=Saccharibacillus brassicae TaxID=2583377 RepID=A0A4Y6V5Q5_SACBS|nr:DNA-entry nuclease (competence-specific nuclease) [Saccharibacillus brassicae]
MILFAWKRFGVVKRTTGVLWAFFILILTIVPKDAPPETVTTNTTPEAAVVQTKTAEPKTEQAKETPKPAATLPAADPVPAIDNDEEYDVVLEFPAARYPQTAAHIAAAIEAGQPAVCTIDRNGADSNRDASLAGLATKAGHDRDEWPMAMCAEGGVGADIAYVELSDNRGSGSWVGSRLRDYEDGTRVLFVLDGTSDAKVVAAEKETPASTPAKEPAKAVTPAPEKKPVVEKAPVVATPAPKPQPKPEPAPEPEPEPVVEEPEVEYTFYENCSAVRAAGADPIYEGEPGYDTHLDRDSDGVGCE